MRFNFVYTILAIALTLFSGSLHGQNSESGLTVGDTLPNFIIPNIINSNFTQSSSEAYFNQLLIIDFWNRGCSSCVAAMPKLKALEAKFKTKLKILPVTTEKKSDVIPFLNNNKYTKKLNVQSVVEDTIFSRIFPYRYVPHEVWIYNGKIIGITTLEYLDEYNIAKVLKGSNIDWPVKNDFFSFDRTKSLFQIDKRQVNEEVGIQYSAISDFREKNNSTIFLTGGSGIVRDSQKKSIRTYFINQPIFNSYFIYLSKIKSPASLIKPSIILNKNQIVWEIDEKNKGRYIFEEKEGLYSPDWIRKNGICFESLYSDTGQTDKDIYKSVVSDLNRLLGLNVRWEKRCEKVFALRKIHINKNMSNDINTNSYSVYEILTSLNDQADNPYFFNESGDDSTKIAINNPSWNDLTNIKNMFKNAGFELYEKQMDVDKLIFTEVDGGRLVDVNMQTNAKNKRKQIDRLSGEEGFDNDRFLINNKKVDGVIETPSGLQYKIIKQGNGKKPVLGNTVRLHYEGRLVNGKIFESTYESGLPSNIKLGSSIIKGWIEGLQLISEGSEVELYIPANLAYGSHTGHGKFPARSDLIFRIELLKVLP